MNFQSMRVQRDELYAFQMLNIQCLLAALSEIGCIRLVSLPELLRLRLALWPRRSATQIPVLWTLGLLP